MGSNQDMESDRKEIENDREGGGGRGNHARIEAHGGDTDSSAYFM